MSQNEAVTLRFAYYNINKSGLKTPLPGSIYDGSFLNNKTGGNEVIFAVAQARNDAHAGRYLLNSTGGPAAGRLPPIQRHLQALYDPLRTSGH